MNRVVKVCFMARILQQAAARGIGRTGIVYSRRHAPPRGFSPHAPCRRSSADLTVMLGTRGDDPRCDRTSDPDSVSSWTNGAHA